ncbi:hypothetical protein ACPPVO_38675 [Dactylosporangium sp. McL0621]|uniref:hypothetical protein n=1 Tax=Dactylosporangium sp. McL0621 TaxID=3415678 RepID=UPI003CE86308
MVYDFGAGTFDATVVRRGPASASRSLVVAEGSLRAATRTSITPHVSPLAPDPPFRPSATHSAPEAAVPARSGSTPPAEAAAAMAAPVLRAPETGVVAAPPTQLRPALQATGHAMAEGGAGDRGARWRNRRTAIVAVVTVALVGAMVAGGDIYARAQYYVGLSDDGFAAAFRGLHDGVAGWRPHWEPARTRCKVDFFTPATQDVLHAGVSASSADDARAKLQILTATGNLRPEVYPSDTVLVIRPSHPPTGEETAQQTPAAAVAAIQC